MACDKQDFIVLEFQFSNITIKRIVHIFCKQDWLYKVTYLASKFPQ